MDPRVMRIAQGALARLGDSPRPSSPSPVGAGGPGLHLTEMTLAQLARLASLQADDPLVARVLGALKGGEPVFLHREAVEKGLGLEAYPPRVREQFARWFTRISGYGVALTGPAHPSEAGDGREVPATAPPQSTPSPAEAEIFAEILGESCPGEEPCLVEPGRTCCGSGRCKTLGF